MNIAICGATGMVGLQCLKILEERNFPVDNLYLFASKKSAGKIIKFKEKNYYIKELKAEALKSDFDIVIFTTPAAISKEFAPIAVKHGAVVIDNSSYWRMDNNVPLIVPEVNPNDIKNHKGIISNPNCIAVPAVIALKPLHNAFCVKRVVISSYQSVSGAGMGGMNDLRHNKQNYFIEPIAHNIIPSIGEIEQSGYTGEETKIMQEIKKILYIKEITATAVRVPVFIGHSLSINVNFEKNFSIKMVVDLLSNAPGVQLADIPTPKKIEGYDKVMVGRLRIDTSIENGLDMFVCADNIRKGAATNAVQIAELL